MQNIKIREWFKPEELDYMFTLEVDKEHPPPESQIRKWCSMNICSVDLNMMNLYKHFQMSKFKKSMETNDKDREKYNRYMRVRGAYYGGRNREKFAMMKAMADERRINHFDYIWKIERVNQAKIREAQMAMASEVSEVPLDDVLSDVETQPEESIPMYIAANETVGSGDKIDSELTTFPSQTPSELLDSTPASNPVLSSSLVNNPSQNILTGELSYTLVMKDFSSQQTSTQI